MTLKLPYFTEQDFQKPEEFIDKLNGFALEVQKATTPQYVFVSQTLGFTTGDEKTSFPWNINNATPKGVSIVQFEPTDPAATVTVVGTPSWHYSAGTVVIDRVRGVFDFGYRYNITFKVEF